MRARCVRCSTSQRKINTWRRRSSRGEGARQREAIGGGAAYIAWRKMRSGARHLAHARALGQDGRREQRPDCCGCTRVGDQLVERPRLGHTACCGSLQCRRSGTTGATHRIRARLHVGVHQTFGQVRENPVKGRAQRATTSLQQGGQYSQHVLTDGNVELGERMAQSREQRVDVLPGGRAALCGCWSPDYSG